MVEILRAVLALIFRLLARCEVIGLEHVPKSGGCLMVVNHLSIVDSPLIFTFVRHPRMVAFVAVKHRRNPFFRWMLNQAGVIWVSRGQSDRTALKAALKALQVGTLLGIAPEGTRSRSASLQLAKPGVAFLASRAEVPIVPAVVINTERAFAELKSLRRPRLILKIGPPFTLAALGPGNRSAQLHAHADEIMLHLAAMLLPRYRGVYTNHPRLPQFLEWADDAGIRG